MACCLIALDKHPGVRPIGVGDTARRIMAKAALSIIRWDAAGSLAGQISGTEAAVHVVRESFLQEDTEAVLLVDASNAFNTLNRQTALQNIRRICPSLSPCSSTLTDNQLSFLWMVMCSILRKAPLKATL